MIRKTILPVTMLTSIAGGAGAAATDPAVDVQIFTYRCTLAKAAFISADLRQCLWSQNVLHLNEKSPNFS